MAPVDSSGVAQAAQFKWHCKHCNNKHVSKVNVAGPIEETLEMVRNSSQECSSK